MPCVSLSLHHCQSTSNSFQYCICRRSVSGECRSAQLGVQTVTWQLLVQYVCYHIHICFSSRSHPRSCQLSQAELSRNAWYAELSKSIIQPVWMCIAEFSIRISFIQCSTNRNSHIYSYKHTYMKGLVKCPNLWALEDVGPDCFVEPGIILDCVGPDFSSSALKIQIFKKICRNLHCWQ